MRDFDDKKQLWIRNQKSISSNLISHGKGDLNLGSRKMLMIYSVTSS